MREITDASLAGRVPSRPLIDACTASLASLGRGEASQAQKQMLRADGDGFFFSISAVVPSLGLAATKWASYVPSAHGRGRSSSTLVVSPAAGGEPIVLFAGMLPTRLRTAASAVAVLEAAGRIHAGSTVGLAGFGPTNEHVARMLASEHGVRDWRVLTRSAASGERAAGVLGGSVISATDPLVLDACDVVVSATGSTSPVADTGRLRQDALVLCLDGRRAWTEHRATVIDDRSDAEGPGSLALLVAGTESLPSGRVLIDQAGSAVTDVAFASVALHVRDGGDGS